MVSSVQETPAWWGETAKELAGRLPYALTPWEPAQVETIMTRYLVAHVLGTVAYYWHSLADYQREKALEARHDTKWSEHKHRHPYPVQDEEGGVTGGYLRILPGVVLVDFFVAPALAFITGSVVFYVPQWQWRGDAPLWSIGELLVRIVVSMTFYELALTLLHWVLHVEPIYTYVHKMHHLGPQCALAGTYMHPLEAAWSGPGLSFFTSGISGLPIWLVYIGAITGRINLGKVHSGWRELDTAGPSEAPFHGVHHTQMRVNTNYGFAEWADKLIGTWVDPKVIFPQSFGLKDEEKVQ